MCGQRVLRVSQWNSISWVHRAGISCYQPPQQRGSGRLYPSFCAQWMLCHHRHINPPPPAAAARTHNTSQSIRRVSDLPIIETIWRRLHAAELLTAVFAINLLREVQSLFLSFRLAWLVLFPSLQAASLDGQLPLLSLFFWLPATYISALLPPPSFMRTFFFRFRVNCTHAWQTHGRTDGRGVTYNAVSYGRAAA